MIAKLTLEAADALTVETTSAMPNALTYFFAYALSGDINFKRSVGVFNNAVETVIPAPGASGSVVIGSSVIQNLNTSDATVILKIGGLEVVRCTLKPNYVWTDGGIYTDKRELYVTTNTGAVNTVSGTLDANTLINGLASSTDTLFKIQTALEALQAQLATYPLPPDIMKKSVYDINNNLTVDTVDVVDGGTI
jgi:hypothetical protein